MVKPIGPNDWKRLAAASEMRDLAGQAVDTARLAWADTPSDAARERWREAIREQARADMIYWTVTGEYFEGL